MDKCKSFNQIVGFVIFFNKTNTFLIQAKMIFGFHFNVYVYLLKTICGVFNHFDRTRKTCKAMQYHINYMFSCLALHPVVQTPHFESGRCATKISHIRQQMRL